jgi:predicted kinase
MKTIKMMVGVSGSGKSSYCRSQGYKVFSTDEIRVRMFGPDLRKAQSEINNAMVYAKLHEEILSYQGDAIYDATNLEAKRRFDFKNKFEGHLHIVCVIEPIVNIFSNNRRKNSFRRVPLEVIEKMYANLDIPRIKVDCDSYEVVGSPFFNGKMTYDGIDSVKSVESMLKLMSPEYSFEVRAILGFKLRVRSEVERIEDYLSYLFREMGRSFHPAFDYRKIATMYAFKALSEIEGIENRDRIVDNVII